VFCFMKSKTPNKYNRLFAWLHIAYQLIKIIHELLR
jgi:hypothetical protein